MGGSIESDPRQHDELRRHLMAQLEYLRSEQGRITQRNVELLQGTECLREQLRHMQRQREIMDRQRLHMEQQLLFMEEQHTTIQQQRAHLGVLQDRIWQKQRELEDLERGPVQIGGATADLAEKFVPVPNGDFLEQAFASFETCASLSTAKQASHEELSRRFCGLYNRLSELSLEDISKRECDTFDERGDCTVAVVDKPNPSCPDSTRAEKTEVTDRLDEQCLTASSCSSESSELSQSCNTQVEPVELDLARSAWPEPLETGLGRSPSTASPRTSSIFCPSPTGNSGDALLRPTNIVVSVLKASGVQVFGEADDVGGVEVEEANGATVGLENRAVTVSSTTSIAVPLLVRSVSPGQPIDVQGRGDNDAFHCKTIGLVADASVEGFRTPGTPVRQDNLLGLAAARFMFRPDAPGEATQDCEVSSTLFRCCASADSVVGLAQLSAEEPDSVFALEVLRSHNTDRACTGVSPWPSCTQAATQAEEPYAGRLTLSRCDSIQSVPPIHLSVPSLRYPCVSDDPSWTIVRTETAGDGMKGWHRSASTPGGHDVSRDHAGDCGPRVAHSFQDAGSIAIEFARHSGVSLASIADMTKNDAHQFPSPTGETDCNPSVSIAREKEEGDARGQKKKSHGCRSSWRPESANHGTQSGAGAKRKDSLKANTACGSRAINSRGAADEWSGSGAEGLTTVMLRNIPNKYNRKQVMDEVDIKFKGKYNFFYLPIDFVHGCNVGYCFINFVDTGTCQAFKQEFEGKRLNLFRSKKICTVTYGRVQGLRAILDHYFNSAVVQAQDASWRPVVLKEGVEQPWSALHTAFPEIFDSDGRLRSPSGDTAASDSQGSSACSPGRAIGRTLPSGRRRGSKLGVTIEAQRKEMRNLIRGGHHSVHRRVAKGGRSPDRAAWGYKHA